MTRDERWLLKEKHGGKRTEAFEADKERLARGEPLGYVIGWQPFLGLQIYLDSHPLIPRPETEWWTERMLSPLVDSLTGRFSVAHHTGTSISLSPSTGKGNWSLRAARPSLTTENRPVSSLEHELSTIKFLDLSAGSGAIGCAALARLPGAQVYFGEIDPAHASTILKNIRENALDESRAHVRIGDLFEPFTGMQFDIIAANPPYVPSERVLPASVADHEPALALYAGADGLDFIRRIATELPHHLAPGGEAWIECDNAHAAAACALFTDQGLNAEIRTDQYGEPRIIFIEK